MISAHTFMYGLGADCRPPVVCSGLGRLESRQDLRVVQRPPHIESPSEQSVKVRGFQLSTYLNNIGLAGLCQI